MVRASDFDPDGEHHQGLATFPWRQAPPGLATRRQLRTQGLRPGSQEPAVQLVCRDGKRRAWLYRADIALSVRPMTLALKEALDKAMAARQTCPRCLHRYFYCLPLRTLASCLERHEGTPADPRSYIASAARSPTGSAASDFPWKPADARPSSTSALQMPPAVLERLLGVSPFANERWAAGAVKAAYAAGIARRT